MNGIKKNTTSRLRHRLTLQAEVQTNDGAGGYSKSWQNIADIWAEIIPVTAVSSRIISASGKETPFAGQPQAEMSHKILIRYRDDVTPAMRFLFDNRIFNIRHVANVEEKDEILQILAQEGVAN